ncbi:MAG: CpsD/CapB family tyrosine-protein kinase [Candidatus Omnitrophica bacterium]|nr:CpsD/CapB family tyrosine-protein kinase [Candidatus Omnitrophota bacterium]
MSKITKALEKAARERLQHLQEQPTVKAPAIEVPIVLPARLGSVSVADRIQVDPHIVAAADPKSPISEQYRILRTNLQSLKFRPGAKVVVITSAVHGEGKTVTAINLALTLSRQENLKVVLVDADMRKGSIHKWLGLTDRSEGLSTVLARGGELNGELVTLKDPNLTILPTGPYPEHPAELLESSHMKRLLATLKTQFDVVIIDAPPVLPVADPGILAAHADGVLLVVRAGRTQRKTVTQAQALLDQMKANVLGCVLTHVEYYLPGYYRYYHEYQYRAKDDEVRAEKAKAARKPAAAEAVR